MPLNYNTKKSVDIFFTSLNDVTINNIESPASKYVSFVWENLPLIDYISLVKKAPNKAVEKHEIYKEYCRSKCLNGFYIVSYSVLTRGQVVGN